MRATDPRVTKTHELVKECAQQVLISNGSDGVTHQRVAEKSGVARATLYRHWPQPDDLLYLAVTPPSDILRPIGDETFREYLVTFVHRLAARMSEPLATAIFTTMLQRAQHDERARQMRDELDHDMIGLLRSAMRTARRRGEDPGQLTASEMLEHLVGPVMFRTLMLGKSVDTPTAIRIVKAAVADPTS